VTSMRGLMFWCDRWLSSDAFLSMELEEQAAYLNLLFAACLRGGALPDNDRLLAKASGDATRWPKLRKVVLKRFVLKDGNWTNKTLTAVMTESARRADAQARYRQKKNGHG